MTSQVLAHFPADWFDASPSSRYAGAPLRSRDGKGITL